MQRKLTEGEIEKLKQARSNINDVLVPTYDDQGQYWTGALNSLYDKIKHGTSDGKPYVDPEPPLTDKDACVWPRRWVMVRDNEGQPWFGPYPYQGKDDAAPFPFAVSVGKHSDRLWKQARRATTEEIESMSRK